MNGDAKPLAILAGVSVFALIIITFAQVPAWVFLVIILLISGLVGNDMSMSDYTKQYDDQKARSKARQLAARQETSEQQAISQYGIYIKPAYKEGGDDEFNRVRATAKSNSYRI